MRRWIIDATAIVLMLCSVAATTVYIYDVRHRQAAREAIFAPRPEPGWLDYASAGHSIGATNAAVSMVVFADYQCPACNQLHSALSTIRNTTSFGGRIVYRHFPLSDIHPQALAAAIAAECAASESHFEQMHNVLYQKQDSLGLIPWTELAKRAGVDDTAQFGQCLRDKTPLRIIQADLDAAKKLGLNSTPTILVNGRMYNGSRPVDSIADWFAVHRSR